MADGVGNQQYILTNTGNNAAFVAMANNQDAAIRNAVVPTSQIPQGVYPLLNGSQVTITGPQNAWFSAVTQVSNAPVWITPGYGQ